MIKLQINGEFNYPACDKLENPEDEIYLEIDDDEQEKLEMVLEKAVAGKLHSYLITTPNERETQYVKEALVKDIKYYHDDSRNGGVLEIKFGEKDYTYTGEIEKIHNDQEGNIVGYDVYIY